MATMKDIIQSPLLLALVCYLVLESQAKKLRAKNEAAM